MRWMHRVRLYPTTSEVARLGFMLRVTRDLYNALLDKRRYAWTARRLRMTSQMQYAEMTALRAEDARIAAVCRETLDERPRSASHQARLRIGEHAGRRYLSL